jgi:CHAT domain
MNVYHANAVALGGNIIRPFEQILESQADSSLSSGRGSKHVKNFNFEGVLSFRHAYSEVDGSFDECHNVYTTYSHAVIEGLDVAGVVFADRIVSRLVVQSQIGPDVSQHSFDLTGSRFENLRIAGHKVDVPLATYRFHQYDTYAKLERAFQDGKAQDLLPWGILGDKQLKDLEKHEEEFAGINGLGTLVRHWRQQKNWLLEDGVLWCSAAAHLDLSKQLGQSELQSFGSIILIPKFGSISLAELQVQKQSRQLIMIRVRLSSPMDGNFQAGRTEVTGSRYFLPEPQHKSRSAPESPPPTESIATEIDNQTILSANHGLIEYPNRPLNMDATLRPNHPYKYWFEITAKCPPGADSEPFIEPEELKQPDGIFVQVQVTSPMLDGSSFTSRNVLYKPGVGLSRQDFSLTTRPGERSLVIQVIYNGHPLYSKKWKLRCFRPNANDPVPDSVRTTPLDVAPMPATSSACRLVDDDAYVTRVSLEVPNQRPFMSAKNPASGILVIAATAARGKLNEFARGNAPEVEGSLQWPATWEMLRKMAIWGHESADGIFGTEATSSQFYKALKSLPLGSRLHIDSHPGSFPWEWIYIGTIPDPKPLDLKSEALQEFLCGFFGYRFRCDILPSADVKRLGVANVLGNLSDTRVLNLINETADLHAAPQHVKFVRGMKQRYSLKSSVCTGGPATVNALKKAVARSTPTHLINVYCHHSPGLELNEHGFFNFGDSTLYMKGKGDEAITRNQLKYDVRLSPFKKSAPVVLLNACGTALGDSYFPSGFMPYFANELSVPAVIGTVAEVPTLAAHQFAREFLPLWLSGGSVHDAMSQLRRDWLFNRGNPYALFYTVYGDGSVHLQKSLKEVEA